MKQLTADDLFALKYGDRVWRINGYNAQQFRYVGRMPSSPDRYLILSDGEMLTHIYIHTDGTFRDVWYSGEYDGKVFDLIEIEKLENRLQKLKERIK